MIVNKRCITAFSPKHPFVALATKSKLIDNSFSMTSELILMNYMTEKVYPSITTELKFCKIIWCETEQDSYLAAGHENGTVSIYKRTEEGLILIKSKVYMDEDITALEYMPSKAVLVAGSCKGKIIFWSLSNLEKEYGLDIPLSMHITSIAWNPKVTKILCVGSIDGVIKVLDIKKNTVVMTLNTKEFSEIKSLRWDAENNTKLIAMTEKPYLSIFDLSNDSVTRVGKHSEALIGFYNKTIVSKNCIEINGAFINIKDSFDCSISPRDPVISLSYYDGNTEILAVPVMKTNLPFFRKANKIISLSSLGEDKKNIVNFIAYKITIPMENTAEDDSFYFELIKMAKEKNKSEISKFLIENYENIEEKYLENKGNISVDLNDSVSMGLINGDFSKLKEYKEPMHPSFLYYILENDHSILDKIDTFPLLLAFSKLFKDFKNLSKIENPRIAMATLLNCGEEDYSILNRNRESRILSAILKGDVNEYINNRIICQNNYKYIIGSVDSIITSVKELLNNCESSCKINSKVLVEYFWFKVLQGKFDEVKDIPISDEKVTIYKQSAMNVVDQMSNLKIKSDIGGGRTKIGFDNTGVGSKDSQLFGRNQVPFMNQKSINNSTPVLNNNLADGKNYNQIPEAKAMPSFQHPVSPPSSTRSDGYVSNKPMGQNYAPQVTDSRFSQQAFPTKPPVTAYPNASVPNLATNPIPQKPNFTGQVPPANVGYNSASARPVAPLNASKSAFNSPINDTVNFNAPTSSVPQFGAPAMPKPPVGGVPSYSTPVNTVPLAPRPPASNSVPSFNTPFNTVPAMPKPPVSSAPSFSPPMGNIPVMPRPPVNSVPSYSPPMNAAPVMPRPPVSAAPSFNPPINNMPKSPSFPTSSINSAKMPVFPPNINPPAAPSLMPRPVTGTTPYPVGSEEKVIQDKDAIISKFDNLVSSLRSKASEKNNLIIRQRKAQCLSALNAYDSLDKSKIPYGLLEAMSLLAKRVETPDDRLKLDVDLIAESNSSEIWFKATCDLIKMLY